MKSLRREITAVVLTAFIVSIAGCSYRPAYLVEKVNRPWYQRITRQAKPAIQHRWQTERLKESRLSGDEKLIYQRFGRPDYIRFFRERQTRKKVYQWVYVDTQQLFLFVGHKQVAYTELDNDSSPLTFEGKRKLFRNLVVVGVIAGIVGLFYAFS